MQNEQTPALFRPLAAQDLNHAEHLLAAGSNPEIFGMLPGHEQKIATAASVTVRLYCDSKTNAFMSGEADCLDSFIGQTDAPEHLSLIRAVARKLGQTTETGSQEQTLHDMTIEIAGDIARQATAANILHAHHSGIKVNSAYDTMISYLANKEGALEEIRREAEGDYSKLGPEAQQQAWESIKSGEDIAFDFEPLLDKTLSAMKAMTDPVMALNDDLPNNTPANLLLAAQVIGGEAGPYPTIHRGLSVVESFANDKALDGQGEHYKLQAVARAITLAHDSESRGYKLTEEMAARTMLSDIRIMHAANLRMRGDGASTEGNLLMFRGEYADLPAVNRAKVFRTIDIAANICPEEKLEMAARCEHERSVDRNKGFLASRQSERSASIAF